MTDVTSTAHVRANTRQAQRELGKVADATGRMRGEASSAQGVVGRLGDLLDGMGGTAGKAGGQLQNLGKLAAGAAGAAGFGLLISGAMEAAQAITALSEESLRLQASFNNVPYGIQQARESTLGFVADSDLAQQALTANSLGAAKSSKEFGELAGAGAKLGLALQGDARKGVEDLTLAISRQSPMILDNLGISLKLSEAHDKYAKRLGKSTSELTDNEKAEAFRKEAIEAAIKASNDITVKTDGWAAAVQHLNVELKNNRDEILGGGVARNEMQALNDLLGGMADHELERLRAQKDIRDVASQLNGELYDQYRVTVETPMALKAIKAEINRRLDAQLAVNEEAEAEAKWQEESLTYRNDLVDQLGREEQLAKARGDDEWRMFELQEARLGIQKELAEAAGDEAQAKKLAFELELLNAEKLKALDDAANKSTKRRGGSRQRGTWIDRFVEEQQKRTRDLGLEDQGDFGDILRAKETEEMIKRLEEIGARNRANVLEREELAAREAERLRELVDQMQRHIEVAEAQGQQTEFLHQRKLQMVEEIARVEGDLEGARQARHEAELRRLQAEQAANNRKMDAFEKVARSEIDMLAASTTAAVDASDNKARAFWMEARGIMLARGRTLAIEAAFQTAMGLAAAVTLNAPRAAQHFTAAGIAGAQAAAFLGGSAIIKAAMGSGAGGGAGRGGRGSSPTGGRGGAANSGPSRAESDVPISTNDAPPPLPAAATSGGDQINNWNFYGDVFDTEEAAGRAIQRKLRAAGESGRKYR